MAASQNGFCSYKLFFHTKTNIMQIMTKNITIFMYLIFYHREIVKLDHFMALFLSYVNTVVCVCDAAVAKSTVLQHHPDYYTTIYKKNGPPDMFLFNIIFYLLTGFGVSNSYTVV